MIARFLRSSVPVPSLAPAGVKWDEARVALDRLQGAQVLHDRAIPGLRSRIDHVVVGRDAVWVVDSRCYAGQVVGAEGDRLRVGGLDASALLAGATRKADVVRVAAAAVLGSAPVRPVLCFERTRWAAGAGPMTLRGVVIARPEDLTTLVGGDGPIGARAARRISAVVGHQLPPAVARQPQGR